MVGYQWTARRRAKRAAKDRSDAIDETIMEDRKRYCRECKVLVLGTEDSGKSTIVKQMKIMHGFSEAELMEYRPTIYRNVLDSAHVILNFMKKTGLECEQYSNRALVDKVLNFEFDEFDRNLYFPLETAGYIYSLWKDPVVPKILDELQTTDYLIDSASYFLDGVLRIGDPEYLPTDTDVLKAKEKTTGIQETWFIETSILMIDVCQRSERRKWIHFFESVTSILFCAALSEYDHDEVVENQNRLTESLDLFEAVVNSRWFLPNRTSVILFLTKLDVFEVKLPKVPLERYFPEYTGGSDINKAAKFILWKFMLTNRAKLSVYPRLTQATDTTNLQLVIGALKETILSKALHDLRILDGDEQD